MPLTRQPSPSVAKEEGIRNVIANPYLRGAPASDNPAIVIKRDDASDLWNDHQLAFKRVWNTARLLRHT